MSFDETMRFPHSIATWLDGASRRVRAAVFVARRVVLRPSGRRTRSTRRSGDDLDARAEQGCLDHAHHGVASGWARDLEAPHARVAVDIYVDEVFVGRAIADRFRPDLQAGGMGDGRHGFAFPMPPHLVRLGGELRAFTAEAGFELTGGPLPLGSPRAGAVDAEDAAAVRSVVERIAPRGGAVSLDVQRLAYGRRWSVLTQSHPEWRDTRLPVTRIMAYVNARFHGGALPVHGAQAYVALVFESAERLATAVAGLPMGPEQVEALARPTGWLLDGRASSNLVIDTWMAASRRPKPRTEGEAVALIWDFAFEVLATRRLPVELLGPSASAFIVTRWAPSAAGGARLNVAFAAYPEVRALLDDRSLSPSRRAARLRLLAATLGLGGLTGDAEPSAPAAPPGRPAAGVHVIALANAASALSQIAGHSGLILDQIGIPWRASTLPSFPSGADVLAAGLDAPDPEVTLLHMQPDDAVEVLTRMPAHLIDSGRIVGFFMWETEKLPVAHELGLHLVDEVWTASSYCVQAFLRAKPDVAVFNVGHLVAEAAPALDFDVRGWAGAGAGATLFYYGFDAHSWITRKNPVAVVRAFRAAFPAGEPVALLIKTRHAAVADDPKWSHWWRELYEEAGADDRIAIRDDDLDPGRMAALNASCDVLVSLHRSEGFGLGLAQAMLCGKPVIASAYSGVLDLMGESDALLVRTATRAVRPGEFLYSDPGQVWGEPEVAHAAELMRFAHANPDAAKRIGENGRARVLSQCSLNAMSRRYAARLGQVGASSAHEPAASPVSF